MAKNIKRDEIVLILETKNDQLMNLVKGALENLRIPVLLKSPAGYYLRGMLPIDQGFFNLRLYVQREFESKAVEIVKAIVPPEEIL